MTNWHTSLYQNRNTKNTNRDSYLYASPSLCQISYCLCEGNCGDLGDQHKHYLSQGQRIQKNMHRSQKKPKTS